MKSNPNVSRGALTRAIERAEPHLRPIYMAVRDYGCAFRLVIQDAGPFSAPAAGSEPTIIMFGDDLQTSKGPAAFDPASVSAAAERCSAAYIIASAAVPETYHKAVTWAVLLRKHVLIVETLPAHEDEWADLIADASPGIAITVSKVDPTLPPAPQTWGLA